MDLARFVNNSTDASSWDSVLATLQEMIAKSSQEVYLIIDNYQVISQSTIHQELMKFIDYLPPNVHNGANVTIMGEWLLTNNDKFRTSYQAGGAGTYKVTQEGDWNKL